MSKLYKVWDKVNKCWHKNGYRSKSEWKKRGFAVDAMRDGYGNRHIGDYELVTFEIVQTEVDREDGITVVAEDNAKKAERKIEQERRYKEYEIIRKKDEIDRLEAELNRLKGS